MPLSIREWLDYASNRLDQSEALLQEASHTNTRSDVEWLLCHALQCNRTLLYTQGEKPLTEQQVELLNKLLTRRESGEPVAYIIGEQEFWSMPFTVNEHVLVPRPETEVLVETATDLLLQKAKWFPQNKTNHSYTILDAGTGSGAIAVALTRSLGDIPELKFAINASDISSNALLTAKENARRNKADAVQFFRSDWLDAFDDTTMDMIISNPPYIAENDAHMNQASLQCEPRNALVSGMDGLDAIRTLIEQSVRVGKQHFALLLEHGFDQAEPVRDLLRAAKFGNITTVSDYSGHDRVTFGICLRH